MRFSQNVRSARVQFTSTPCTFGFFFNISSSNPPMAGETLPPSYNQATGADNKSYEAMYEAQFGTQPGHPTPVTPPTQPTTATEPQVVHQTVIVTSPHGMHDPHGALVYCPSCKQNVRVIFFRIFIV